MKRLDFTGSEAKERYEILYEGVTGTTRGFQAPSETRVVGKILDKLEAIGTPTETPVPTGGSVKSFALRENGGAVDLEDAEFNLMNECVQAVKWNTRGARRATAAVEWFQAATEPPKPTLEK